MGSSPAFLVSPRYELGESEEDHTSVKDLERRAAEFAMVLDARAWGWGSYFRTDRSLPELAVATGAATLRAAGVDPASVDALIVCATSFPGTVDSHGAFLGEIMAGLGLTGVDFAAGSTLNRCNNLLAGIRLAESLVTSGAHRRVLVVTTDRVEDETERLESFALFSDGAASCLITAEEHGAECYRVLATASAQDVTALGRSDQIDVRLSTRVNAALLGPLGLAVGDVSALMSVNLVRPLVSLKERQAGFAPGQLWTANIERVGHCFAADPVINLVDRAAAGHVGVGGTHLLASSVPGARHGVLLRRTS